MQNLKWWNGALLAGALCATGCGGSEKKTAVADPVEVDEAEDEGEELIPEEKFGEIKNTFERKASTVARCFPMAVEAGELDQNEKVQVSVGVVILPDGTPSEVSILAASKRSKTLESCVLESVERWEFTTLPRPLQYSYGFKLQSF